jgi:hypothetical protein
VLELLNGMGLDPYGVLCAIVILASLFVLAYRRFIFSLFDPLCLFLAVPVADSVLIFLLPWPPELKWQYAGYVVAFWLGFCVKGRLSARHPRIRFSSSSLFTLELTVLIMFVIIIAANLYVGASVGFPLLSKDPSVAKVISLTGGFGIVRRVNMGPYLFFSCGCLLMAMIGYKRRLVLTLLFMATIPVALNGSKGVLLPLIYILAFLLWHSGVTGETRLPRHARKYLFGIFFSAAIVALIVTTKDQGGIGNGISSLFMRLLLSGDTVLLYFARRQDIIASVDPGLFGFLHYLLGDTLGILRISDYQQALGSIIIGSDDGFGPNAQYFVQADLFFGPYYGLLYAFATGYVAAWFRSSFLSLATDSAMRFTFQLMLAVTALDLAIEPGLFVVRVATIALFVGPAWLVARLIQAGTVTATHRGTRISGATSA